MTTSGKSLTLEQLAALNDEMAAIIRLGVPLEVGLRGLGRELPGQLGRVTQALQERIAAGEDLPTVIAAVADGLPAAYRSIMLAGLRAGHLPAALQAVADSAGRIDHFRRTARLALFYPILVVVLAYAVFVLFSVQWIPTLVDFYEDSHLADLPVMGWLSVLADTARWWAPLAPLVFLLGAALWYARRRRTTDYPLRSMRYCMQVATLTELLASMVEQDVPLTNALSLAADASGNQSIMAECRGWQECLERGEAISQDGGSHWGVPPWVAWLLRQSRGQAQLARNLRQAARQYRDDALRRSQWWARVFPVWVTILVGGAATLLTALFVAVPWLYVLYRISTAYY